jgi:small subunit ribosomal protein S2
VIPGNDDAIRAVKLYVTAVADAVLAGKGASSEAPVVDEFVEVLEAEGVEVEVEVEVEAEAEVAEAAGAD